MPAILWEDAAVQECLELLLRDRRQGQRVANAIVAFGRTGRGDIRSLQGRADEFRLRVGEWRHLETKR